MGWILHLIGDSALHGETLFGWAMFEMDGFDERQENAVKIVCGDMAGGWGFFRTMRWDVFSMFCYYNG